MSQLGEYIHVHRSRYRLYGISRVTENSQPDFEAAKKGAQQIIENKFKYKELPDQKKIDLENYYNNLLYGKESKYKPVKGIDTLSKEVYEILKERANNQAKSFSYNTENIKTSLTESKTKIRKQSNGYTRSITFGQIEKRIKIISSIVNNSEELNAGLKLINNKELNNQLKSVDDLKNELIALQQILQDSLKESGYDKGIKSEKQRYKLNSNSSVNVRNALILLDEYLEFFKGSWASAIAGKSFEIAVAIDSMMNSVAEYSIDELKKVWTPTQKSNEQFKVEISDKIAQELLQKEQLNQHNWKIQDIGGTMNISYDSSGAAGTVDVVLQPKEDTDLYRLLGGEELRASLKNYSTPSSRVSVFHGNYFVRVIELGNDFTNHYLNLLGTIRMKQDDFIENDNLDNKEHKAELKTATSLIYSNLAIRSVLGEKQNNDVLIINDRQKQKVTVKTMKDIFPHGINGEIKDLDEFFKNFKMGGTGYDKSYGENTKLYYNYWSGQRGVPDWEEANKRIANYLLKMHNLKIHIALKM